VTGYILKNGGVLEIISPVPASGMNEPMMLGMVLNLLSLTQLQAMLIDVISDMIGDVVEVIC